MDFNRHVSKRSHTDNTQGCENISAPLIKLKHTNQNYNEVSPHTS
jgi:hypothetical protein